VCITRQVRQNLWSGSTTGRNKWATNGAHFKDTHDKCPIFNPVNSLEEASQKIPKRHPIAKESDHPIQFLFPNSAQIPGEHSEEQWPIRIMSWTLVELTGYKMLDELNIAREVL
jgi:hypothetical protein